jgi:hypothetical protein
MGWKKRSKTRKVNKKKKKQKGRSASSAVRKSREQATRRLDEVVQEMDRAVDSLQSSLEQLRGTLPELIALGVHRDRLQLIRTLAEDGILDTLQRLAQVLDNLGPGDLPNPLVPFHRSARMVIDRICRSFEVEAVYQPGQCLTLTQDQIKDLDWSADRSAEIGFPVKVKVIRSGWKAGDVLIVLPRVKVCQPEEEELVAGKG